MVTIRMFTTGNESFRLLASDPDLRESLLGVLEGIMARDAGTINPAVLSGPTTDYQRGYPLVFNICDVSPPIPLVDNIEPQQDPYTTTESQFLDDFNDLDMIQQTPFPSWSLGPGPVSSLTEGIPTDASASPIQNAVRSLPSVESVTKGNKRTYQDTTKQNKRKASLRDGKEASTMIEEFLAQERVKCKDETLLPEHTYFDMNTQNATSKFEESLAVLLVTIAAPQRIASLRDIICCARVEKPLRKYILRGEIVPSERVKMILELDEKVAGAQLVQWYHIIALFEACGGPETRSVTRFVNNMPTTFQPQTRGCFGNPANRDDANVAQTMMEEIYPDLQAGTVEYRTKLATFKKIRQLGKRLHLLVEKFGRGVLGLMMPFSCENGMHRPLPDFKILNLRNSVFDEFVKLLDDSQGDILRQFSVAVFPPLWALLQGRLEEEEPFSLERVGRDKILELTKGSPDLLRLIS
ncbi:uncharacterized protein BJX67DRAFT_367487 [Aspergillus lucknowensis]|uniref:Uncharacterized protein n=1 Tax=Aspergillus lucknowensis TaxID=176173 RepID=A0ABR4L9G1_9EURO